MSEAYCIILKFGKTTRTRKAVLTSPPFPKVGDLVKVKGDDGEWTVSAVIKTEVITEIQRGEA